jgi:hypothetical protein
MKTYGVGMIVFVLTIAPAAVRGDDESHRKAAEELLKAVKTEKVLAASIDQSLDMQVKANPAIKPFREVMKKFLTKHLSYAALKNDLIKLYTKEFTEKELKQLAAFYKTPVGKKAAEKMPALMAKAGQLGMKRVQDNQEELKKMIQDELKKKTKE